MNSVHWNTKYLRKSENHTNALAVNLLDNSETTHRPYQTHLSNTSIQEPKWYMSYATGHSSLTSQYLWSLYIYRILCRACMINLRGNNPEQVPEFQSGSICLCDTFHFYPFPTETVLGRRFCLSGAKRSCLADCSTADLDGTT
jgi:hypothetical protein